jgi:DHA1 family tetracycline resistance protein-like MFS transporter
MAQTQRTAAVKFIFVTILLDAIGLGLLIPVLPDVLRRFSTDATTVSQGFGIFIGLYALMQFMASPVLGSISDRFGRRPILLVSLLGAGLDYVFMAFAPALWMLYLGRVISGLTGASMTVAGSYMADVSDDSNRSANFGMIGAAFGVGFVAGPALGGVLVSLGPKAPFLAAAGLNLLNFVFGLFVLPESLKPDHRRHIEWRRLNPFSSVLKVLSPSPYVMLIWVYFLLVLAGQVHPINWTLYTETKFGWTPAQVGLSLSFVGLTIGFSNAVLTRVMIPRLGEPRALNLGLWVSVISFALFGLATQGWMMYAIMAFFAVSGLAGPALQSMVSRQIPPNRQGEFQGSLVSLGSLGSVVAPLLFTSLFVGCTRPGAALYFPGAAYIGASAICLLALGLDFLSPKNQPKEP